MSSVFDDLSRLEQLKRNNETPLKQRMAEVLYRDKYDNLVTGMRDDWKHLDVPHRNLKETKENYGQGKFLSDITDSPICGDGD